MITAIRSCQQLPLCYLNKIDIHFCSSKFKLLAVFQTYPNFNFNFNFCKFAQNYKSYITNKQYFITTFAKFLVAHKTIGSGY